jgi:undecaprenyl-diphosphatase
MSILVPDSRTTSISPWDRLDRVLRGHRSAWIVFAIAAVLFSVLTLVVLANPSWLAAADTTVTAEVSEAHNGALNRIMFAITLLGNRWVIGSLLIGISAWVWRTGRCRTPLAVMIGAFLFNPALEAALKGLVGRPRPDLVRLVSGDGPAFPSGHVLATVGFYGVLAIVAWRSTTKRSLAVGALAGAATVIALVGFSRIYLGVHWMSDVVGGYLIGAAFVLGAAYLLRGHHFGAKQCDLHHEEGKAAAHPARVPSSRAR